MWIELHDGSRDHPKLIKVARDLGLPKVHAYGHLCSLWTWALRMAPDGDLSSFDVEDIEIGAEWEGGQGSFVAALVSRGLIDDLDGKLRLHDWESYAHHLKAAEWKRQERKRKACQLTSGDASGRQLTSLDTPPLSSRPTDQTDQTDQTDRPARGRDTQPPPPESQVDLDRIQKDGTSRGWPIWINGGHQRVTKLLPITEAEHQAALEATSHETRDSPWAYYAGCIAKGREKAKQVTTKRPTKGPADIARELLARRP